MKKQMLLMAMAVITTLFVSGQAVTANAKEKPVTESPKVIAENTKQAATAQPQTRTAWTYAGDSMGTAASIGFGTTYSGAITLNNTKDFYRFTLNSSGRVTISANANIKWVYYDIYDSAGNELYSSNPSWNNTTEISNHTVILDLTKGTYYFSVSKDGSHTGNYNFKMAFSSAGESFTETGYGTNNELSKSNTIAFNRSYRGQIAKIDDRDFYKFTIGSSGRITISANANMKWVYYKIYDSSGNELYSANPSWNSSTEMISNTEILDLTKGTYYFSVSKDGSHTGTYNFKMAFSGAGESFTETGYGTNNELFKSNTIALNRSYRGQIALNDEKDFYKFTISSPRKVKFTATAAMKYIEYKIYDSKGNELWSINPYWNSAKEFSSVNESIDLAKGTYYLGVVEDNYSGKYNFKLSSHSHSYKTVVSKAKPSKNGKIVKKCSCGLKKSTSTIYAPKKMSLSTYKYTYNGNVKKPSVTIKDSRGRTISKSNYKVTYSKGRKYVGRYTVKVTFKGNYSGTMYKKFDIVPKGTSISKVIKGRKSFTVKWRRTPTQTSGYQIQYSRDKRFKKGNKTVTVGSNKSYYKKITKLTAKRTYYVRVRTYKNVKISGKNVKMYSGWSRPKAVRTR